MKKRIYPLVILILGVCSIYVCGSLISRDNWYLSHNDFTHFETEEEVEAFLNEHLVIGQSTRKQVTVFLDTLDLRRCENWEYDVNNLTRFVIDCFVRPPKPHPSELAWLEKIPYISRHWWYYIHFQIDNGILAEMYVSFYGDNNYTF